MRRAATLPIRLKIGKRIDFHTYLRVVFRDFEVVAKMSSDEEDLLLLNFLRRRKKNKKRRKFWVHPYIYRNHNRRLFIAAKELAEHDSKFQTFYRMSKNTFKDLMLMVGPALQKQNTNMRECVSSEERLMITLR